MIRQKLARLAFNLKTHATVWLIAFSFAMVAYGLIHLLLYAIRYVQKLLS